MREPRFEEDGISCIDQKNAYRCKWATTGKKNPKCRKRTYGGRLCKLNEKGICEQITVGSPGKKLMGREQ